MTTTIQNYCVDCGTDLVGRTSMLACPDCGKRYCGMECLSEHTRLGVCPDTQDEPTLRDELAALLNRHSRENHSDTPDVLLAEFLTGVLSVFDQTVRSRENWYGRPCGNGASITRPAASA